MSKRHLTVSLDLDTDVVWPDPPATPANDWGELSVLESENDAPRPAPASFPTRVPRPPMEAVAPTIVTDWNISNPEPKPVPQKKVDRVPPPPLLAALGPVALGVLAVAIVGRSLPFLQAWGPMVSVLLIGVGLAGYRMSQLATRLNDKPMEPSGWTVMAPWSLAIVCSRIPEPQFLAGGQLPALLGAVGVGLACFGWLQAKLSETRGRLESVAWTAMAFFGLQLVAHLYASQLSPALIGGLAIMSVAYPVVYALRPRVFELCAAMAFQMLLAAY